MFSSKEEYQINYIQPDWKGEKVAISLSKKGEEASKIIVVDVNTKAVLPGVIKNCTPSIGGIQWLSDNSGFIYLHVPIIDPTNKDYWINTSSVLYTIGSDPDQLNFVFSKEYNDELSLNREDFPLVYNYDTTDEYVFGIAGGVSTFYDRYYKKEKDLSTRSIPWKTLCKKEDKVKRVALDKDALIFLSGKDASNFKICKTYITDPDFENPTVLVPEKEEELITDFKLTKEGIFFITMKNGIEAKMYSFINGVEKRIILPNPSGRIQMSSQGLMNSILRLSLSGYLSAPIDYLYNTSDGTFVEEGLVPKIEYLDFKDFIVEHKEIPSHDGTMVPVIIIRNPLSKKDGNNHTLFYGYGAYGGARGAGFNPNFLTWVAEGGILVFAYVRGGGQKGESWHKAGYKTTKSNTWKDMIATTEYLIKEGYTSLGKSALWGSSAGGILAGRAMTERPDLYKAVIMTSPSLNMIRSEIQPNGQNSIKEFGTVKIKEEFEALLEMNSYHHIEKGINYPGTLVTGGMKDGRVVIWDPAKFVAKLQKANASKAPILFNVDFDAGHGGKNNSQLKRYEIYANAFAFAFWQTGHPDYQPEN